MNFLNIFAEEKNFKIIKQSFIKVVISEKLYDNDFNSRDVEKRNSKQVVEKLSVRESSSRNTCDNTKAGRGHT